MFTVCLNKDFHCSICYLYWCIYYTNQGDKYLFIYIFKCKWYLVQIEFEKIWWTTGKCIICKNLWSFSSDTTLFKSDIYTLLMGKKVKNLKFKVIKGWWNYGGIFSVMYSLLLQFNKMTTNTLIINNVQLAIFH